MKKRKIIALIITFVGLIGFFVILKNSNRNSNPQSEAPGLPSRSNPALAFESQLLNPPSFKTGELPVKSLNLTENLAKSYAQKIFEQNKEIKTINGDSKIVLPSFDITEIANQSGLEQFDSSYFESKDINLTADNSTKSQIVYLESLDSALKKNFGWLKKDIGVAIDEFLIGGNNQTLKIITGSIPNLINDFLKIPVPSSFKLSHLQTLNIWQKKLVIYTAILNVNNDPLKTYLALQQLPDLISEDIYLNSILIERYNDLTLN